MVTLYIEPPLHFETSEEALAAGANPSIVTIKFNLVGAITGANEDPAAAEPVLRKILDVAVEIEREARKGLMEILSGRINSSLKNDLGDAQSDPSPKK
jgi:hypothetical protein